MLVAVSNPKTFARASSFWAGIDGFKDADVFSDLKLGGGLVRTCMVRSTLHIIPSKDYHTYIHGGASERMLRWIDAIAGKKELSAKRGKEEIMLRRSCGRVIEEDSPWYTFHPQRLKF